MAYHLHLFPSAFTVSEVDTGPFFLCGEMNSPISARLWVFKRFSGWAGPSQPAAGAPSARLGVSPARAVLLCPGDKAPATGLQAVMQPNLQHFLQPRENQGHHCQLSCFWLLRQPGTLLTNKSRRGLRLLQSKAGTAVIHSTGHWAAPASHSWPRRVEWMPSSSSPANLHLCSLLRDPAHHRATGSSIYRAKLQETGDFVHCCCLIWSFKLASSLSYLENSSLGFK